MAKYVANGCLTVRKDPAGSALTCIYKNDFFDVLETSADGLWFKVLITAGGEGWISKSKWFQPIAEEDLPKTVDPPWLTIALDELKKGVAELHDPVENPRIVEYLKTTTLEPPAAAESDETDWCSAFVNWCFEQCGIKGTGRPNARSWLGFGDRITTPRKGCVVVFKRPPNPAWGHVGFYIGEVPGNQGGSIAVLGGNQGDAVTIAAQRKKMFLGYRWPSKEAYPGNS